MKRYDVLVAVRPEFMRFTITADSPEAAGAEAVRCAERQAFAEVGDCREVPR